MREAWNCNCNNRCPLYWHFIINIFLRYFNHLLISHWHFYFTQEHSRFISLIDENVIYLCTAARVISQGMLSLLRKPSIYVECIFLKLNFSALRLLSNFRPESLNGYSNGWRNTFCSLKTANIVNLAHLSKLQEGRRASENMMRRQIHSPSACHRRTCFYNFFVWSSGSTATRTITGSGFHLWVSECDGDEM